MSLSLAIADRSRKLRRAPTCQVAILELEQRLAPATYVWTAGATGDDENRWSLPANWRIGANEATVKPGWTDDVVFDGGPGGDSFSKVDEYFTVRSLTIAKAVGTGAGGTLTLAHNLTVTGDAPSEIAGGNITGSGELEVGPSDGSQLTWIAGVIKTTVTIATTANLILTGDPENHDGDKQLQGGTIVNNGTASWDGEGELKLNHKIGENNGGKIINNGVFAFNGTVDKEITGSPGVSAEVINNGTININYTAGKELRFYPNFENNRFTNLVSGHAKTAYTEVVGPITIAAGSEFRMGEPNINETADIKIAEGNHGAQLIAGAGKAIFGPGSIVHLAKNPGQGAVKFQNVDDHSSLLYGNGDFVITGEYRWFGDSNKEGIWQGDGETVGTVTVGSPTNTTAKLSFNGKKHAMLRELTNYGTINWVVNVAPAQATTLEIGLAGRGTITNKGGSTFNVSSVGPVTQKLTANQDGRFINSGTLNLECDKPAGKIEMQSYDEVQAVRDGTTYKGTKNHKKGKLVINGKEVVAAGNVNIWPGAEFVVLGGMLQLDGEVANAGQMEVLDGYSLSNGTITNQTTGSTSATFLADSVSQTGGTFVAKNAAVDIEESYTQTNGAVELDQATVVIDGGWSVGQLATMYSSRTTLVGDLSISGLLKIGTVSGSVYPDDTFSVDGDYTQDANGRLTVDLTTGNAYDRLVILGHGSFAGTLTVQTTPGYTPMPGTSFDLIRFESRSGSFNTLVLPSGNWTTTWMPPDLPTLGVFRMTRSYY